MRVLLKSPVCIGTPVRHCSRVLQGLFADENARLKSGFKENVYVIPLASCVKTFLATSTPFPVIPIVPPRFSIRVSSSFFFFFSYDHLSSIDCTAYIIGRVVSQLTTFKSDARETRICTTELLRNSNMGGGAMVLHELRGPVQIIFVKKKEKNVFA